ncbi:hypothetical protein PYCCODRAFT_1445134 [Trametes coccinea BRFM310]|uniref:Mid2 domain-containing protein n=1 Tax=Trametes coccinea (strain BRFM310) TaxID=1353009 RepID=A0A1Y2IMX5_TRAC3|nr:hypothetical protein PYCCODRAFT_1445134 [Trametes coccinea BRFM310]
MFRRHNFLASFLLAALWCSGVIASPGNTTCASSQLDWYTSVVGETPCATYQRLRQICNSDYLVPQFRTNTPGDNCDDQLSTCCCNSVSWALSMLCMNCQYDTGTGGTGIDAGDGAYELYSSTCGGNPLNKTLPADIQTAVCNREIKIDRNLYSLFWDTGACVYTKETMTKDFAATNNNTFTHCNSTLKASAAASVSNPSLTSSSTSSSTASSAAQSTSSAAAGSSTNLAPILGGAIGGVAVALVVALIAFILFRRQRRRQGPKPLDLSKEYSERSTPDTDQQPMSVVTPYSISGQSNSGYGGGKLTMSEEFALLPRSPRSPGTHHYSESSASATSKSPSHDAREPDRHEDAGPIPALQRSASGRLPPAYRSWEASGPPVPELPVYDLPPPPPLEGDSTSAGPSDTVGMEYRGPLPLGDVKVRPPS